MSIHFPQSSLQGSDSPKTSRKEDKSSSDPLRSFRSMIHLPSITGSFPFISPSASLDSISGQKGASQSARSSQKLNKKISSIACSSMGDIEEEVKMLQKKNEERIIRRRASSFKAPPKMDLNFTSVVEDLPRIRKKITKTQPRLEERAHLSPGKMTHVKKRSTGDNKTGYALTYCENGEVYVHIPKSIFDRGGEAEVKLALNAKGDETVVISKREDDLYNHPHYRFNSLHKVSGDLKIMERCRDCRHLAVPYGCTARVIFENKDWKRYVYTITKYYRGGNLEEKCFSKKEALRVALGISEGILAMHDAKLVHRDIKQENVLYENEMPIITDFGTVGSIEDIHDAIEMKKTRKRRDLGLEHEQEVSLTSDELMKIIKVFTRMGDGTEAYKPPETCHSRYSITPNVEGILDKNEYYLLPFSEFERDHPVEYTQQGDIFSFGVLLYAMLTQSFDQKISRENRQRILVEAVEKFRLDFPPADPLLALVYSMLNGDPQLRPSIHKVLSVLKSLQHNAVAPHRALGFHRLRQIS